MAGKPLVALVGRPNVGKSTLFNRLVGGRIAVTDDIPGTTRDRLQGETDWGGINFLVVDTGGIEVYEPKGSRDMAPLAEGSAEFVPQIRAQALMAIQDADVIVMLVDARQGVTAADEEIAEILRRTAKPVLIAANKTDTPDSIEDAYEFYGLGLGEVFPISAIHSLGIGDLLDGIVAAFADANLMLDDDDEDEHLKIAIVGRPNVGKSTLLNHLLGEDRAIVSDLAGTTRDAIDTDIRWHGERITLIDTAGVRRRGKIEPGVEKYSVLRTMRALERADVALLLIDANEGVTEQDQHIAGYVKDAQRSIVIVVNKWDAIEKDAHTMNDFRIHIRERLEFLPDPPVIFVSALTGQRIHQVLEIAYRVWETRFIRIQTSDLNRIVREAVQKHTPPTKGTKRLKVYYASQVAVNPPVILFHVNDTRLVHFTYKRYLENQIRAVYPFEGTPIRLSFRPREGLLED
ncbi:MAG: ribosome biogenesis GTPase Der [Chloroflexi bacterium]|nr:MAG: ribosome biogenesis GTPase Der [Chloroflexota bacterium]